MFTDGHKLLAKTVYAMFIGMSLAIAVTNLEDKAEERRDARRRMMR